VTLVVGFSAGGGMDTLGRIVAEAAGEALSGRR
jgi:tripartite-type tricarboxylate transporter receptor subunit TctC